jgi:hypothetical protein
VEEALSEPPLEVDFGFATGRGGGSVVRGRRKACGTREKS